MFGRFFYLGFGCMPGLLEGPERRSGPSVTTNTLNGSDVPLGAVLDIALLGSFAGVAN